MEKWISATSCYNYMMKDPVLDWYEAHYQKRRSRKQSSFHHFSPSSNSSPNSFLPYIMEQGIIFERKIMKLITKKFESDRVIEIHGEENPRSPEKVKETLEAMRKGVPIIHSGVLHNPENDTFGIPDLLVRNDWLQFLVYETYPEDIHPAPNLSTSWHYVVVDIKYCTLPLKANETHLLNINSFPAYKAQLLVYTWALGNLQGYTPPRAYILGRAWKYTQKGISFSGSNSFQRLGVIDYSSHDKSYIETTNAAINWIREVRSKKASKWNVTTYPLHRWELYPNMCNIHDGKWRGVKQEIASTNKELTDLWMVGPKNRNRALEKGIYSWKQKGCTSKLLSIPGKKTSSTLNSILRVNKSSTLLVTPAKIKNNEKNWQHQDSIEFFIDFESHNEAISRVKNIHSSRSKTIVFMIGVGYCHPKTKEWIYKDFTSDRITFPEEKRISNSFVDYIRTTSEKYNVKHPKCYHWSNAEVSLWETIVDRHSSIMYDEWIWIDMLRIFKQTPITIQGCKSFSLKDVAKSLKKLNLIQTIWNTSSKCIDGQSAMLAAYKTHRKAVHNSVSMRSFSVFQQIINYNEVDVKVLYEILSYLRIHNNKKNVQLAIVNQKENRRRRGM